MPWLATMTMIAAIRAADTDGCVIEVTELPVPARTHHRLEVDGGRTRLDGEGLRLKIRLEQVIVRLVGRRYFGELRLAQSLCKSDRVHHLRAHPRPATLVFTAAPPELVVRTFDGPNAPAALGGHWILAHDFPALPVGHGANIDLEFRAPGYAPQRRTVRLLPGDNELDVVLAAR
ncbi:MAG: hypothetical protein IAG13_24480 [Deltaproteobacteria bacterium]|nr:hypothetical protein [Nannocystaceae bacterium]